MSRTMRPATTQVVTQAAIDFGISNTDVAALIHGQWRLWHRHRPLCRYLPSCDIDDGFSHHNHDGWLSHLRLDEQWLYYVLIGLLNFGARPCP